MIYFNKKMEKIYSRYYYPIEFYNPHAHLEYNHNKLGLNEAEIKALEEEEYKNKYEKIKELKSKQFTMKYNKSAILYEEEQRMKNKEENLIKKKEKDEQLLKTKNYNKTVYEKNMKPFLKEKEKELKAKTLNKTKKTKNTNNKTIKTVNNQNQKENNIDKELVEIDNNYLTNELNNLEKKRLLNTLDSKENLNEKINTNLNEIKKEIQLDNNVIDLRMNLESQLLEQIKNKNNNINNQEINDEVNEKISTIKRFRTYGYLPEQQQNIDDKKKKKDVKTKKFSSEFERRRFIKALKNIFTERLGEHNIYIQNICSCGNLQKQLTALVEKGNLTVFALTEVDCANNCVFYKNKKAYLKNINDVLKSIKEISYENFHNKYKEQK